MQTPRNPKKALDVLLCHSLPYAMRQDLSFNLELAGSLQAPATLLYPSSTELGFQMTRGPQSPYYMGDGDSNSGPRACTELPLSPAELQPHCSLLRKLGSNVYKPFTTGGNSWSSSLSRQIWKSLWVNSHESCSSKYLTFEKFIRSHCW